MVNLFFLGQIVGKTAPFRAAPDRPALLHKAKRAALRRPVHALDPKIGQHIERMVALQQLEKLPIRRTMHIPKLLKIISDLARTMSSAIAPVKCAQ
jgi:hypothetical protein